MRIDAARLNRLKVAHAIMNDALDEIIVYVKSRLYPTNTSEAYAYLMELSHAHQLAHSLLSTERVHSLNLIDGLLAMFEVDVAHLLNFAAMWFRTQEGKDAWRAHNANKTRITLQHPFADVPLTTTKS